MLVTEIYYYDLKTNQWLDFSSYVHNFFVEMLITRFEILNGTLFYFSSSKFNTFSFYKNIHQVMRVITGIMIEIVFYLSNIDLSMHLILRNAIDLAEIYCSIAEKIIKANTRSIRL